MDFKGTQNQVNIITLMNAYGQIVYSSSINSSAKESIDISHLPSGMYLVHVESKDGRATRKFIVED
ncbi:MAG: T9SS type A sorting domain-containing protein [Bacteroidetes bacterium]|nr:T9SS type A sorting domain-containing protein [Bacteroidota bacterium]